ncbi:hypothetical protein [Plastoroseomonas hellenica]|uniref:hypothetical protein n=1 Tax=Plastoroseomonas hellenica TaxID=2687306 RepID=UPI001BA5AEF6|nr:hypothetical protein [Plastoroseomonas hellenica]MBR0647123.1 hypothetical protein [Plastoroseomonas hellenica]
MTDASLAAPRNRVLTTTIGGLQVVGGFFEASLGAGMMAIPSFGLTQVIGVVLVAHGSDTFAAGFRTWGSGEVQPTLTQQAGAAAAGALGASPRTAQLVGDGVDLGVAFVPGAVIGGLQRVATWGARASSTRVTLAYARANTPPFGPLRNPVGHNAIGVQQGGTTVWVEFVGKPTGGVEMMLRPPSTRAHVLTDIAVTADRANRAALAQQRLVRAGGEQTWRALLGPNCTTTALEVLREAGIVVPIWSRAPVLLNLGLHGGVETSIVLGTVAAGASGLARPSER